MRPSRTALLLFLWPVLASGIILNITVDDQNGDEATGRQVTYSAVGWNQGNGCYGCAAKPNPNLTLDATWHDGLYTPAHNNTPRSFSFTFNGTAVWIFGIMPVTYPTTVNITLDGDFASSFDRFQNVSASNQFAYNVTMYASGPIPFGEHTVSVTTTGPGGNQSLILFDYAIYTTDTSAVPAPSPTVHQHSSSLAVIIGASVGGAALLLLCLSAILLYRLRTKRKQKPTRKPLEPFSNPGDTSGSSRSIPSEKLSSMTVIDELPPDEQMDSTPAPSSLPAADDQVSTTLNGGSSVALQEQLVFFRRELQALRFRAAQNSVKVRMGDASPTNSTASSSAQAQTPTSLSSLAGEIAMLRAELARLQTDWQASGPSSPRNSETDAVVQREIALLRSEMEELRTMQLGDTLPAYMPSPPPLPPRKRSRGGQRLTR